MSFRIESYKEEYLDGMVGLGYKVLNQQWKHANQTTAKNLEKAYSSNPNFDPSTKLYLFEDDKLVAFLPSTIKPADENGVITANMEFPIADKTYPKAAEVEKMLIDHAFDLFRERGVNRVISRANERWGKTQEFVNQYGYSYVEDNFMNARTAITDLTYPDLNLDGVVKFYEYNLGSEYELMIEDSKSINAEQSTKSDFKYFEENLDRFVLWSVMYHNEKAVASVRVYTTQHERNQVILSLILSKDNNEIYRSNLLNHVSFLLKDRKVDYIELVLYKGQHQLSADYETYGMKFGTIKNYIKNL